MSFFSKDSRMDQWLAVVSQREGPGFKSTNRLGPLCVEFAWALSCKNTHGLNNSRVHRYE